MPEVSEQWDRDEAVAQITGSLEMLARALHVRDAQLQPTLDAIVLAAMSRVRRRLVATAWHLSASEEDRMP